MRILVSPAALKRLWAMVVALTLATVGVWLSHDGSRAFAQAGTTLVLTGDIILRGSDSFVLEGTPGNPCIIEGNSFQIKTVDDNWKSGRFVLRHCIVRNLGTNWYHPDGTPNYNPRHTHADKTAHHAIYLRANGTSDVTIESTVFDSSSSLYVLNATGSSTTVRNTTVLANSIVPSRADYTQSFPSMVFAGYHWTKTKLFQGNHIYKSYAEFQSAGGWLIGGPTPAESNILIGLRAGIFYTGKDATITGNYVRTFFPGAPGNPFGSNIPCLVASGGPGLLIERNIFRHAHKVVNGLAGELRYNLILDMSNHHWISDPRPGSRIHHNIFARYSGYEGGNQDSGLALRNKTFNVQIYNNTFDGNGLANDPLIAPAIEVGSGSVLDSLRNNVFYNFAHRWHWGTAAIRPAYTELITAPRAERLLYADYNLFYNPHAQVKRNYGVAVASRVERVDPGFALNDATAGTGIVNEQVEPQFTGPIPTSFPFSDEEIQTGSTSVFQIIDYYWQIYKPAPGSPLIGAGDPSDGPGTDIGAVAAEGPPAAPQPPAPPTGLTAAAGNSQISLSWTARSGATSYSVKRSTTAGGLYEGIAAGVTGTSYTDVGLTNGTTYYYVVSAVNGVGEGANSNEVSATPVAFTPTAFAAKINYQPASSPVPAGYLKDDGAVYGARGNGYTYGWNVVTPDTRDRNATNSPDQRYDTLNHMHKPANPNAVWEIAVPNGTYTVRIISGDPSHFDSVFRVAAEGVLTVSGTPTTSTRWIEGTQTVTVTDGRLTVTNGAGAQNNKICFIEITRQ